MIITDYQSAPSMGQALAGQLQDFITANSDSGRKPSILISGGSSPSCIWPFLQQSGYDYSKGNFTTTDERVVLITNEHCNARNISFLDPLWLCDPAAQKVLNQWSWPADLIILGFGASDGHIGSLFTPDDLAHQTGRLVKTTAPYYPNERISFNFPTFKTAKNIWLLAPDKEKTKVLSLIMQGKMPQSGLALLLENAKNNIHIHRVAE